jgi:hypothetical protein
MEDFSFKRKKFKDGIPLWFIFACLLDYKFNSFKKFLIYLLHFSSLEQYDLKKRSSKDISTKEIIETLSLSFNFDDNISRRDIYTLMDISKNTFRKHFKEFFIENQIKDDKKKFTLYQTYQILNHWQGRGNWAMLQTIKKKRLAEILTSGNYKKLAFEATYDIDEKSYKNKDKLSPSEVKAIIKTIESSESKRKEVSEKILNHTKFKELSLWTFGIIVIHNILLKHSIQQR